MLTHHLWRCLWMRARSDDRGAVITHLTSQKPRDAETIALVLRKLVAHFLKREQVPQNLWL